MFEKKKSTQVLVVGAGPVGLFAALELARKGISVEVVDEQWRTGARSFALALHPRSMELFAELGLAEELRGRGHALDAVAFYEGGQRRAVLEYSLLSSRFPFLLVVPQNEVEQLLERELEAAGVRVHWNHRLARLRRDEAGLEATVQTLAKESTGYSVSSTAWVVKKERTWQASFVLGTDGHRSIVRRNLGIDFEDLGGARQFAIFECDTDRESAQEARVFFAEGKNNVLWPLPGNGTRFSFELSERLEPPGPRSKSRLTVGIGAQSYPHLSEEALRDFIDARAPWFDRKIENVRWSLAVRFERRLASSFGEGRVRLAGDAAHVGGPIGVQSMNVGFREAHDLAGAMETVLEGQRPLDLVDEVGERYRQEWLRLLEVERDLEVADDADAWVRQRAEILPACVPASGEELDQLLRSLGLHLA